MSEFRHKIKDKMKSIYRKIVFLFLTFGIMLLIFFFGDPEDEAE